MKIIIFSIKVTEGEYINYGIKAWQQFFNMYMSTCFLFSNFRRD